MKAITCKKIVAVGAVLCSLFLAPAAIAEGDAEQGAVIGYSCLGCHGIEGYRNAYPSFRVPRLGGQKPEYVRSALLAYRDGTRSHTTMNAQGESLSDDEIDNLVAWLAELPTVVDKVTEAMVAELPAAKACIACHGEAGSGVMPAPATLSGQQQDYLAHALKAYRDGDRTGSVMSAFAGALTDEDIDAISRFYARQDGLQTLSID